ncbi:hypothetical protein GGR57DRAFT_238032 [Xylariaceae sp. FL1272]|nr:hypothetical protein GGR57DRAFT_238032 [Xylariaceae sp. FL1272]
MVSRAPLHICQHLAAACKARAESYWLATSRRSYPATQMRSTYMVCRTSFSFLCLDIWMGYDSRLKLAASSMPCISTYSVAEVQDLSKHHRPLPRLQRATRNDLAPPYTVIGWNMSYRKTVPCLQQTPRLVNSESLMCWLYWVASACSWSALAHTGRNQD